MANCIQCKKPVSDEEFKVRYEILRKMGIVPMMITICKECREAAEKL